MLWRSPVLIVPQWRIYVTFYLASVDLPKLFL
jgi:hypothetical protein